ncbi:hypothetical protein D3C74_476850 [compost metagenome]
MKVQIMQRPFRFCSRSHTVGIKRLLEQGVHLQAFDTAQSVFQGHFPAVNIPGTG